MNLLRRLAHLSGTMAKVAGVFTTVGLIAFQLSCLGLDYKLFFPLFVLCLVLFGIAGILKLISLWAPWEFEGYQERLRAAGLCPHCGYDLRATPDRCPECGKSPKK